MDNAEIINHCAEGDREAMELLYRRYRHKMMRIIRKYLHDDDAAEDVLHDGFILIFSRINEVKKPRYLEYWMATVMKNLCLDYLSNIDLTTILDEEFDTPDLPELEEIIPYEELERIIERLPKGYRNIFRLAVLENKSHKEIGKILGINPNSSSSQLFHARQLLQKMVAERKRELGLLSILLLLSGASVTFLLTQKTSPVILPGLIGDELASLYTLPSRQTSIELPAGTEAGSKKSNTQIIAASYGKNTSGIRGINHPALTPAPENISEKPEKKEPNDERAAQQENKTVAAMENKKETPDSTDNNTSEPLKFDYYVADASKYSMPKLKSRQVKDNDWTVSVDFNFGGMGGSMLQRKYKDDEFANSFNPSTPPETPPEDPPFGNPDEVTLPGDDDGNNQDPDKDKDKDKDKEKRLYGLPTRGSDGSELSEIENDFPLTLSITVSKSLTSRLSLETGINYSSMDTKFRLRFSALDITEKVRTYYLGIPLKIRYEALSLSHFSASVSGGAMVDFPIRSDVRTKKGYIPTNHRIPSPEAKTQWSFAAGIGLQYNFNSHVGIYLEPSLRYNFKNEATLPSYWQEHRVTFAIPLGLKLSF
ncbi:MAG: sigma-70 family RNA polymerase sigma factor [Muribaculaceae bacterium]|nr:sigma-70 family RNA polymerase sigma factor [Muribaculaceae bacterium]